MQESLHDPQTEAPETKVEVIPPLETGAGLALVPDQPWHPALRLIFRPVFCLALALLLMAYFSLTINWAVPWVARNLLWLTEPVIHKPSGSGDTLFNYVQLLTAGLLSLIASLVWTLLDSGRKQYTRMWSLLSMLTRYHLAMMMLSYGFAKVFVIQFGELALSTLLQPMGEMSPMGLLWNFMAYSPAYVRFTGTLEVLAGLLLLFRRTTMLGALLCLGVMGHVLMLNLCYDVPVKLFSAQLVFQSLLLLSPDLGRLTGFFLLGRAVAARTEAPFVRSPGRRRAAAWFKGLVVTALLALNLNQVNYQSNYARLPERPVLYGVYEVERFVSDGREPQANRDPRRWERLVVEWPGFATLDFANGETTHIRFKPHENRRSILIAPDRKAQRYSLMRYELQGGDRVRMHGEFAGHQLDMTLVHKDSQDFPLINRGFHWINEVPFNR